MTTTYAIRGGEEGARRLDLLARVLRPTIAELAAFTEDSRSTIACPRIFQVRGRKPVPRH